MNGYWKADTMTPAARQSAIAINYTQPLDGQHITLPDTQLFAILSRDALQQIKNTGECIFSNTHFVVTPSTAPTPSFPTPLIHLTDTDEGAEMWVADDEHLPIIVKMKNNPVEIDWDVTK